MRIRGRWAVLGLGRFTGTPSGSAEKVTDGLSFPLNSLLAT